MSAEGMDVFRRGLRPPSLCKQLQSILSQYEDSGQILKELIQNADDAKASRVVFLYDKTQHGTAPGQLLHPGLDIYQGPALFAYNDAVFTKDDWENILLLHDSKKATDKMKVGRFGLGFKSVFHITDLPEVLSGHNIGAVDPHERLFTYTDDTGMSCRTSAMDWKLEDLHREKLAPFMSEVFVNSHNGLVGDYFPGTVFRFPLRCKAHKSLLSDNQYDERKVRLLLDSLSVESEMSLLFLKNIEKIEIYERQPNAKPQRRLTIEITQNSLPIVKKGRRQFLQCVKESIDSENARPVNVDYIMSVEILKYEAGVVKERRETSWMVVQYLGGGHELWSDINEKYPGAKHLPWVSTAVRLGAPPTEPAGHVFCFLPLPLVPENRTGLHMHVNGYFAVDQSRRYLKWPSLDQKEVTDPEMLWNQFLLKKVLPRAMVELIMCCIQNQKQNQTFGIDCDLIYSLIPDPSNPSLRVSMWKKALPSFFKLLVSKAVFFKQAPHPAWLKWSEVIFSSPNWTGNERHVLRSILLKAKQPFVEPPSHVRASFEISTGNQIEEVTPLLVRSLLKKNECLTKGLQKADRLTLLQYLLSDRAHWELRGISHLLPLANGDYSSFSQSSTCPVFIDNLDIIELLPGAQTCFIAAQLPAGLLDELKSLAESGYTQLQLSSLDTFPQLLNKVYPPSSTPIVSYTTQFNNQWLRQVWQFIQRNFTKLDNFAGLHLIPTGNNTLGLLSKDRPVIEKSSAGYALPQTVIELLAELQVIVVNRLPPEVRHVDIRKYVQAADSEGVARCLSMLNVKQVASAIQCMSHRQKVELRNFFAQGAYILTNYVRLVSSLPILQLLGSDRFCSAGVRFVAPLSKSPIPIYRDIIALSDDATKTLVKFLSLTIVTEARFFVDFLLPLIKQNRYTKKEVTDILADILDKLPKLSEQESGLGALLREIPFIETSASSALRMPCCLFDPSDPVLKAMFLGLNEIPHGKFARSKYVDILKKIGLKCQADVSTNDILRVAELIGDRHRRGGVLLDEASALMTFLSSHCNLLSDWNLVAKLSKLCWVPVVQQCPPALNFASQLPWGEHGISMARPDQVIAVRFASIVGSVQPLVSVDDAQLASIGKAFHWDSAKLQTVLSHLKNLTECYCNEMRAPAMMMMKQIYEFLNQHEAHTVLSEIKSIGLDTYVWTDSSFVTPQQVMLSRPPFSLEPYVYSLPSDMSKFHTLLSGLGVEETVELTSVLLAIKHKHHGDPENYDIKTQEVDRDLGIVLNILNKIASDGSDTSNLLIPVHTQDGNLRMMDILEVCYCDKEWYQKGKDEDDVVEDDEKPVHLIHPKIPLPLADKLQVPSMTSQLLDSEPMAFGQSESLTRRLHTLLHDYSDGLAVLKELIQNADDAGAKEVRFLFDERENLDARAYLFDKNMADLQGPALLAYNDAEFSEADFMNIVKLSAESKLDQTTKVGRFGLGFNSIYNLTDVPFLVSNGKFVVFDPHRRFLGKALRNNDPPGLKLDINKHRKKVKKMADQFKPFEGIFGCKILETEERDFKGTLFRFPLRTSDQAYMSEISKKHYSDRAEVAGLLQLLVNCADSILLFLQNVLKITIWHIPDEAAGPSDMDLLFSFERQHKWSLRNSGLSSNDFNFLDHVNRKMRSQSSMNPSLKAESNTIVRVTSTYGQTGTFNLEMPSRIKKESLWLVSQAMGQGQAFNMSCTDKTLLPVGGVAVPVKPGGCRESDLDPGQVEHSSFFCFLPLPSAMSLDLPVHVNGYFAITTDRRHLFEQDSRDREDVRAQWNQALMIDAVTLAYVNLLEDLSTTGNIAKIGTIWPEVKTVQTTFSLAESLKVSVYKYICRPGGPSVFPLLVSSGTQPICIPFENCVFLDTDLLQSDIRDVTYSVFEAVQDRQSQKVALVSLSITKSLKAVFGDNNPLKAKLYNMTKFYSEIFLPNVATVEPSWREQLLIFALLQGDEDNALHSLLKTHSCIPVAPDGQRLQRPDKLVHPFGPLKDLFSAVDGRTPYLEGHNKLPAMAKLMEIGMTYNDLPWEDILQRCQSVEHLYQSDQQQGIKRINAILHLMDTKLKSETQCPESVKIQIQQAGFLPVCAKPKECLLSWAGDHFTGVCLSPQSMYHPDNKDTVGSVKPIVDLKVTSHLVSSKVKKFLGFNRKPQLDLVLKQLEIAMETTENAQSDEKKLLGEAFRPLYSYLNNELKDKRQEVTLGTKVTESLKDRRCIYTSEMMCLPSECSNFGPNRPPYLNQLPDMLKRGNDCLLQTLGIKLAFGLEDLINCLLMIHKRNGMQPLSDTDCKIAIDTVNDLARILIQEKKSSQKVEDTHGVILIPDQDRVMCQATELCFNNCPWLETANSKYCHEDITWQYASAVGVRTIREADNEKNSMGLEFGQEEELSSRIRRILSGYPFDKEVFNELLQNADDAGATDIHFVLDVRMHGTQRLFEDSWGLLQGPALCVFNNRPFTANDIMGIQKLGQGNKDLDPTKTGQYGVGFNCVYHLTDTPTILTDVEGEGLSLCAFDPNLLYVPCATKAKPGRLYKVTPDLQQSYSDVFKAYLPEHLSVKGATIFRFPLRTEHQAKGSKLSNKEVKPDNVREMFQKYIENGAKSLLFLNNIKSVKISEISQKGEISVLHHIWSESSQEDLGKQILMRDKLMEAKNQLFSGTIDSIQPFETTQHLTLEDSHGLCEEWLIVKRLGFNPETDISDKVLTAFNCKAMCLLPRGGVAYCTKTSAKQREKGSWFCLLPLPIETHLPIHFNGHFALDYENRRNVWKHDAKDAKADWNHLLMKEIIAPAYVSLIKKERETVTDSKPAVVPYERIFPQSSVVVDESYDGALARAVYKIIADNRIPVLPAFVFNRHGSNQVLEWFPPTTSQSQDQVYFNDLKLQLQPMNTSTSSSHVFSGVTSVQAQTVANQKYEALNATLQRLGVPMVIAMLDIHSAFQAAGVETQLISPEAVTAFLRCYDKKGSRCHIEPRLLPASITETAFSTEVNLHYVLSYCLRYEDIDISGLPLQLRQDNIVTNFKANEPIFASRFAALLPNHKELFLHPLLLAEMQTYICSRGCTENPTKAAALKDFTLTDLAGLLGELLPEDRFITDPENIPLRELEIHLGGMDGKKWLALLWMFLVEFIQKKVGDKIDKQTQESLLEILNQMHQWKLLPVYQSSMYSRSSHGLKPAQYPHLIPVSKITTTVDLTGGLLLSQQVQETLKILNIPQPYFTHLFPQLGPKIPWSVLSRMLGNVENPKSVIGALRDHMNRGLLNFDQVNDRLRNCLHDYFKGTYTELVHVADVRYVLQNLPIFFNTCRRRIALFGRKVFILSSNVPTAGADILESSSGSIFLMDDYSQPDFHIFLGCQKMTDEDFYTKICLQNSNFHLLGEEDRLVHLRNVKDRILPGLQDSNSVLYSLKHLQFLKDRQGNLTTASSFHDKENSVFASMHADIPQPQSPYQEEEWRQFLIKSGMISELTDDMFVEYAKCVEAESQTDRGEHLAKKSKVLVKYLVSRFSREKLSFNTNLLRRIRNIKFIVPHRVCDSLTSIHPQYGAGPKGSLPLIAYEGSAIETRKNLLWVVCPLLPNYASKKHSYHNSKDTTLWNKHLGICNDDELVPKVVQNMKAVCGHLGKGIIDESVNRETFKSVMESTYDLLNQCEERKTMIVSDLKDMAFVAVENWEMLTLASRLCTDITSDKEIKPFLFKIPHDLAKYNKLFKWLGTQDKPTLSQYEAVLKDIYLASHRKENLPSEKDKIKKAVKGFFHMLSKSNQEINDIRELYLPCEGGDSKLCKSTSLVCIDILGVNNRIANDCLEGKPFLLDLNKHFGIKDVVETLKKMPSSLQPCMLSGIINVSLEETDTPLPVDEVLEHVQLQSRLVSHEFGQGLKRLAYHNMRKRSTDNWDTVKTQIDESCQTIQAMPVDGFKMLKTYLTVHGTKIEGSEAEVSFYFKPSDQESGVRMYLNIGKKIMWSKFSTEMAKHFYAMKCCGHLKIMLFEAQLSEIEEKLDEEQITSLEFAYSEYIPAVGSYVPVDLHPFLDNDLREMFVGDYAALEIDDPVNRGEEGVGEYIFIKILERLEHAENTGLWQRYRVQIGVLEMDSTEVNCEEVYMFKRPDDAEDEDPGLLVTLSNHQGAPESGVGQANNQNNETQNEPVQLQTFSEIKRELCQTLTDTWELPEERRRKVIKRLLFKWHPDKNLGREDLCTKVFQWLQNAVHALEEGRPIPEDEDGLQGGGTYTSAGGAGEDFWEKQFRSAGQRARYDRQHWNNRQERRRGRRNTGRRGRHGAWGFYQEETRGRNPQPGTARRWLQQAQHDLRAATFDGPTHSEAYDWACYKAHQAAEKALTAILYSVDANLVSDEHMSLSRLVLKLSGMITAEVSRQVTSLRQLLSDKACRMMYPTAHSTPLCAYTEGQAVEAARLADQIVDWAITKLA